MESHSESSSSRNRELSGMLKFGRETFISFGLALLLIVYVVQAYRIPSGSMEDSLLIGDQLLGLKFVYGAPVLPFTHLKFPAIRHPHPGDVVIFKSPGNSGKDYIKRCVAGPGQTVEVRGEQLLIDSVPVTLPPEGKFLFNGQNDHPDIEWFKPLRVPSKGDHFVVSELSTRELLFLKHLIHQEHPFRTVRLHLDLTLDGVSADDVPFVSLRGEESLCIDQINARGLVDTLDDWVRLDQALAQLNAVARNAFPDKASRLVPSITLDDKTVEQYTVLHDNYFMLGDNRDNSADSRYWGFVNDKFVKAEALLIYFSLDTKTPLWLLPLKIRWNRVGKLIRGWDGTNVS